MATPIDMIRGNISDIQAVMVKLIKTPDQRVNAEKIYAALEGKIDLPAFGVFKIALSNAVTSGAIVGFTGFRGRTGGYGLTDGNVKPEYKVRADKVAGKIKAQALEMQGDESEKDPGLEVGVTYLLNKDWKIQAADRRNWVLKHRTGENIWIGKGFYSSLREACQAAARKIMDKELRISDATRMDLDKVLKALKAAEEQITGLISAIVTGGVPVMESVEKVEVAEAEEVQKPVVTEPSEDDIEDDEDEDDDEDDDEDEDEDEDEDDEDGE